MTQRAEFECDRRASVHLEDKALEEEQGSMKDSEAQADASRARMSNVSNESEHAEPSKATRPCRPSTKVRSAGSLRAVL
jgi:hypothetical protein